MGKDIHIYLSDEDYQTVSELAAEEERSITKMASILLRHSAADRRARKRLKAAFNHTDTEDETS